MGDKAMRGNTRFRTIVVASLISLNNDSVATANILSDSFAHVVQVSPGHRAIYINSCYEVFENVGSDFHLSNNLLQNNIAVLNAGGLASSGDCSVTIQYSSINDNAAATSGGVHLERSSQVDIMASQVIGNRAGEAGGISVTSEAVLHLYGQSVVAWNRVLYRGAGMICSEGGFCFLDNVTFSDNIEGSLDYPQGVGGGVLVSYATLVGSGLAVIHNTAQKYGGGLYVESLSRDIKLSNTEIRNNTVQNGDGGGLYISALQVFGGAIYMTMLDISASPEVNGGDQFWEMETLAQLFASPVEGNEFRTAAVFLEGNMIMNNSV
eukprot:gene11289-13338_t